MKHLKNIKSYKDLKEKYRAAVKANHPDNGGSAEAMQEVNNEYDILFHIWKNKAEKENQLEEEEKKETASGTRRKFYTEFGWEGSRYNPSLSLKEIAKIVRGYVKEKYPTCKFSVKTKYASMCQSLIVDLLEFPEQMYKTREQVKDCYFTPFTYVNSDGVEVTTKHISEEVQDLFTKYRVNRIFTADRHTQDEFLDCYEKTVFEERRSFFGLKTDYFKSVIDDVNAFIMSYNYDDSDSMIDYFSCNFYGGEVNYSSCEYVPKVARIKKEKKEVSTSKDNTENVQVEKCEKPYTIEKSTHTKTWETIYLVKWIPTLSRAEYVELNNKIKSIGGYYSKFTHSFIFKNNPENDLDKIV